MPYPVTRRCVRVGGKEFNSHSFALCPRVVDIADKFEVPHLMLVMDGGYRNVVRCPASYNNNLLNACLLLRDGDSPANSDDLGEARKYYLGFLRPAGLWWLVFGLAPSGIRVVFLHALGENFGFLTEIFLIHHSIHANDEGHHAG
jgi:hypothetical protein